MRSARQRRSDRRNGSSPEERLRFIANIWNEIQANEYYGSANQVVVEETSRQVTDAMSQQPPDVDRAEELTFYVLHVINGDIEPTTT
jgi:hypothetical protein